MTQSIQVADGFVQTGDTVYFVHSADWIWKAHIYITDSELFHITQILDDGMKVPFSDKLTPELLLRKIFIDKRKAIMYNKLSDVPLR